MTGPKDTRQLIDEYLRENPDLRLSLQGYRNYQARLARYLAGQPMDPQERLQMAVAMRLKMWGWVTPDLHEHLSRGVS